MNEPVSQSFLIEILQQMETRVDEGHGRVRQSLNELKAEMREGFTRVATRDDQRQIVCHDHDRKLCVIQAERETEKEALRTRRQDARDRNVLVATLTSMIVTVVLFVLKAWLHL